MRLNQNGFRSRRAFLQKIATTTMGGVGALSVMRSAGAALAGLGGPRDEGGKAAKTANDELVYQSATALARLIRDRQASSEEIVEAFIERIRQANPRLNAVCQLAEESALKEARKADAALYAGDTSGPLHGVPVTIKDSLDTEGIISTGGTLGRKDFIPKKDAAVVARLRAAGAIVLGKTNTPELTLAFVTDNLVYGRTNNPYDLARTPGGSSGGAAAAVAAGCSPLDLGSDTSGSLRVPAHYCGVASLKPTAERVPLTGHIISAGGPIGNRTVIGPLARYIEDLALVLPIISGPDGSDPTIVPAPIEDPNAVEIDRLRAAFFEEFTRIGPKPVEDIRKAVRLSASTLSSAGVDVVEDGPENILSVIQNYIALNDADGGEYYRRILRECGTRRPHDIIRSMLRGMAGRKLSGAAYHELLIKLTKTKQSMLEFMEDYDLLICPVCSNAAPKHDSDRPVDFSFSFLFSLLGWPVVTLRAGQTGEGLPIGVQIAAKPWKEHIALAAARVLEDKLGGWRKPELVFNEA